MTDAPLILWLDDPRAAGNGLLGGKLSSLAAMTATGVAVPPGFGVTTAAYRAFMASADLAEEARRIRELAPTLDLSDIKSATAGLIERLMTEPLPEGLEAQIRDAYAELERRTGVADAPVAVRSSGESEDLAGASFAGQYETFLWICGADAVIRNMRACWAGMFGEAVLSYRPDGQTIAATSDFGICVGVQLMVEARAAGVMFTLDPINGDRSKIVLESCWGLGEGVVKGDVTPSQFTVDKVTFEITKRKLSSQTEEYRFDPTVGGVALVAIEAERQDQPCVSEDEVVALAKLAKQLEQTRGEPQDVEWALSKRGEVWALQARPETVWSQKAPERLVVTKQSPVNHVLARLSGVRLTKPAGGA